MPELVYWRRLESEWALRPQGFESLPLLTLRRELKERGQIMRKFILGYILIMSLLSFNTFNLQTRAATNNNTAPQKVKVEKTSALNDKGIIENLNWIEIPQITKKKDVKYYITSPQKRWLLKPGKRIKVKVEFDNPQGGVLSQKDEEKSAYMIADAVVNCQKGYLDILETIGYNVNFEKTFVDKAKKRYGEDTFLYSRELFNENQEMKAVYKQTCLCKRTCKR